MTRTRNMADLLDSSGDIKSSALDNVPPSNDASALTTGTLPAARLLPRLTVVMYRRMAQSWMALKHLQQRI